MNLKNLVIGILGILAIGVVVTLFMSTPEEVDHRVVQVTQYEDRSHMQDVLVAGKDMREYNVRATYELSTMASERDRIMCETKIVNLIMETASQTGLDPNGARQIHTAIKKALVNISRYDNCGVRSPFVSVFETVPGD
ncbi:hypothetical protein LCGC14_1764990 [marine sediment metagenome]|uniref:Uncharacterized protein n=1 Tax=marine sediment metagenome TaxID=412755 RepID=A0A0F9JZN5_9ZZZZ